MTKYCIMLVCFCSFTGYAWNFTAKNAYDYTPEEVTSNLVYAINERCMALYWGFSTVTNYCTGKSEREYHYQIEPINIESFSVAWSGQYEEQEEGGKKYILPTYEYSMGDTLPEGYLWVKSIYETSNPIEQNTAASFKIALLRRSFLEDSGMEDKWIDLVGYKNSFWDQNVLIKISKNDFSEPNGLIFFLNKKYRCENEQEYSIAESSTWIGEILRRLTMIARNDCFIDKNFDSIVNPNKPTWFWEDRVYPGYYYQRNTGQTQTDDVGPTSNNWDYVWNNGWLGGKAGGSINYDSFPFVSKDNFMLLPNGERIGEQIVYERKVSVKGNANQFTDVPGWIVGNLTNRTITASLNLEVVDTNKKVNRVRISDDSSSYTYDQTKNAYVPKDTVVFDLSFNLQSTTNINGVLTRTIVPLLYSPQYKDMSMINESILSRYSGDADSPIRYFAYNKESILNNSYYCDVSYNKEMEKIPAPTFGILKNKIENKTHKNGEDFLYYPRTIGFYGDYPNGANLSKELEPNDVSYTVSFGRVETKKDNNFNIENEASGLGDYFSIVPDIYRDNPFVPAVSPDFSPTNYISTYDEANKVWRPNYDLSTRYTLYKKNKLENVIAIDHDLYSGQWVYELIGDNNIFSYDLALTIWEIIKNISNKTPAYVGAYERGNRHVGKETIIESSSRNHQETITGIRTNYYGPYRFGLIENDYDLESRFFNKINVFDPPQPLLIIADYIKGYTITDYKSLVDDRPLNDEYRYETTFSQYSFQAVKHPDMVGNLVVYGAYEDQSKTATFLGEYVHASRINNSIYCEIRVLTSYKAVKQSFSPNITVKDLGMIKRYNGLSESDIVKVGPIDAGIIGSRLDYTVPEVSYDGRDRVDATANCPAKRFGDAKKERKQNLNIVYKFIWEWDYKYK